MNKKDFPTPNFSALAKTIIKDAIIIAEKEAVNFFKESFFNQGFTDLTGTRSPLAIWLTYTVQVLYFSAMS